MQKIIFKNHLLPSYIQCRTLSQYIVQNYFLLAQLSIPQLGHSQDSILGHLQRAKHTHTRYPIYRAEKWGTIPYYAPYLLHDNQAIRLQFICGLIDSLVVPIIAICEKNISFKVSTQRGIRNIGQIAICCQLAWSQYTCYYMCGQK